MKLKKLSANVMDNLTLILTINKRSFEVMVTGEKQNEYRTPSNWIMARLSKNYQAIKFINGYGNSKPYFIAEYKNWNVITEVQEIEYSNGHKADLKKGLINIHFGKIIEVGNYEPKA